MLNHVASRVVTNAPRSIREAALAFERDARRMICTAANKLHVAVWGKP